MSVGLTCATCSPGQRQDTFCAVDVSKRAVRFETRPDREPHFLIDLLYQFGGPAVLR